MLIGISFGRENCFVNFIREKLCTIAGYSQTEMFLKFDLKRLQINVEARYADQRKL